MPVNRTLGLTEKGREFSTTTDLLMTLALGFRVLDGSLWLGPGLCNKGLGGGEPGGRSHAGFSKCPLNTPLDWMMAWMILLAGCLGSSVAAAGLAPEQRGRYSKGHTRSCLSFLPILQVKCSSRGRNSKKEANVALAATEGDGSMYLQVESPPPLKTPYFSFFPNLAVPFP